MPEFADWDSFYVIVGSAAGGLIGLQFVVMTLIAERPHARAGGGAAFATPTIVHFAAVLFLAAIIRAPWQTITFIATLWGLAGMGGIVYALIVIHRMRKQDVYRPVFEDWMFHAVLPVTAYLILAISPFLASTHTRQVLFGIGTAALLLLFIGIHNSWDGVAYHVFVRRAATNPEPAEANRGKRGHHRKP